VRIGPALDALLFLLNTWTLTVWLGRSHSENQVVTVYGHGKFVETKAWCHLLPATTAHEHQQEIRLQRRTRSHEPLVPWFFTGVETWKSKLLHFFNGFSISEAGHTNSEYCGSNLDLSWRLSRTLADSRKSRRSNTPQWAAGWGKSHSKDLRKFWQQAQEWFPVQSSYSKIWITQEDRDETSKKSDVLLGWRGDLYSASCRIYRGCDKRMVVITHFSHQPTQIQDTYWQGYCIQTLQVLRWGPVPKILQNQGWKPGRARTMS